MDRASTKAARLLQIEALLLEHAPQPLRKVDIARRVGVERWVIQRDLPDLTERFGVYENEDGRLTIDRETYLTHVRFTLHEAMAVHIAARLMATWGDKHNPHAASALRKLGLALERLAPSISSHLKVAANVMDDAAQRRDPVYLRVLETITRGWADQRQVRIAHQSARSQNTHEYLFSPYFIEPSGIGSGTYAIGYVSWFETVKTLKIERIRWAELTSTPFTVPDDFDVGTLLGSAWGVMFGEEMQEVRLRFAPSARRRLSETVWHQDEVIEDLPDGGCRYTVCIAHPLEMKWWIRSWGPQVVVEAPEELRREMAAEAQQMAEMYRKGKD
ncbi:MAG: WYL domain-containing protein [Anaerolineae bacterium]